MTIRESAGSVQRDMKVLIDTNVLLDVLSDRAPYAAASSKVLKLCEIGKIEGYISALSVPNIVYIMRKELEPRRIKEILGQVSLILGIADLKGDDLKKAAELDFGDYEDALQSVAAKRIRADYIVTRNIKDFNGSRVTAIKPEELLERI